MQFSKTFLMVGLASCSWTMMNATFPSVGSAQPLRTEKSLELEAQYAEAVIAFNGKRFDQARQILDQLLRISPNNPEALELKALSFKSEGKQKESIDTYRNLIKIKPEAERGPYYFELGSLYFQQKNIRYAKPLFERSIERGFNLAASHFFLGLIAFQAEQWYAADKHFAEVVASDVEELAIASHYYLGIVYFKTGYANGATQQLIEARQMAQKMPESPIARDITVATDKALAPFDQSQWFGNLSFLTQWDGNVSLVSPTVIAAQQPAGLRTLKNTLVVGAGRVSSPLKKWQYVASYRLTINKNYNKETRDYEFFSNVPSLFLTYNPLARTAYGFKAEGNVTFQNLEASTGGGSRKYRPYSTGADVGPYVRHELVRRVQLTGEVIFRPQKFGQDPSTPNLRRSGNGVVARSSVQYLSRSPYLNPEGSLSFENYHSQGVDFRTRAYGLDLSNDFRLSPKDVATAGFAVARTFYPVRVPRRQETTVTLRASYVRTLNAKLSLLGDFTYSRNDANIPDTFSYRKPVVTVGLSYNL